MDRKQKDMIYLQTECLFLVSKKLKISLKQSSILFKQYHIFEYIAVCYDYLHLSGVEYVVDDIMKRIKGGVSFVM